MDEELIAGAVILSQGQGTRTAIIMMVGRELTSTEQAMTGPELCLRIAYWGIKRLARWVMFTQFPLSVVLPDKECLVLIRDRDVHHKIRALIIGLSMFGVQYSAQQVTGSIAARIVEIGKQGKDDQHSGISEMKAPQLIH